MKYQLQTTLRSLQPLRQVIVLPLLLMTACGLVTAQNDQRPKPAEEYLNSALAYHEKGDIDRVIQDLNQAISLDPMYEIAYVNRGIALIEKGDLDNAIQDFTHAITLGKNPAIAYLYRASVYRALGKNDLAVMDEKKALGNNQGEDQGENNQQLARLQLYVPGLTTEKQFLADGWWPGRVYYRKIGILSMSPNGAVTEYTLGYAKLDADDSQGAELSDEAFQMALIIRGSQAQTGGFRSRFLNSERINQVTEVCKLTFENDVLKGANCLAAPQNKQPLLRSNVPQLLRAIEYVNRGLAYAQKGDYDRAIKEFNQAISINPKVANTYNSRGKALLSKQYRVTNVTQAIQDFDQAILLNPKFAEAYFNRAGAYMGRMQKGDYDRAIQDINQTILLDPTFIEAYYIRGNAYLLNREPDRAVQDFTKAISTNPGVAKAYLYRGTAYFYEGEYDRAIQDYNQAISLDPKFADAYSRRGSAYAAKRDFGRAIQDYSQVISFDPKDAGSYAIRGDAFRKKGDLDLAIQDFTQAISLNPTRTWPYEKRGEVYVEKGDLDRAIQDFTQVISLSPKSSVIYVTRGDAYSKKGDLDRAIQDYDQAISLDPKFSRAYERRAIASRALGKKDLADADERKAQELSEGVLGRMSAQGQALMDKVQPLISAGKDDEALKALDRFLTIEPTNAEGYFLTGTIYHRKGDEEASINSLKTAIFWKNKHIQSHILLARIYISKGECASAQSHAKTALEIDPNNQEAIGLQKLLETGKCR